MQDKDIYPGQTIVIGDALAHDILGGNMVNIDTCLVKTGLHANAFANAKTPAGTEKALMLLANQFNNVRPKFLVESLKWGDPLPDRKHKKRRA